MKTREILTKEGKYKVEDAIISPYHFSGRTSSWQYGSRYEDTEISARKITVSKGDESQSFVFEKKEGTFYEVGDSSDKGKVSECYLYYSAPNWMGHDKGHFVHLPMDIDFTDINALRYAVREDKSASHFLDKFVIVTPKEKRLYMKYAKPRDEAEAEKKRQEREEKAQKEAELIRKRNEETAKIARKEKWKEDLFGK